MCTSKEFVQLEPSRGPEIHYHCSLEHVGSFLSPGFLFYSTTVKLATDTPCRPTEQTLDDDIVANS